MPHRCSINAVFYRRSYRTTTHCAECGTAVTFVQQDELQPWRGIASVPIQCFTDIDPPAPRSNRSRYAKPTQRQSPQTCTVRRDGDDIDANSASVVCDPLILSGCTSGSTCNANRGTIWTGDRPCASHRV